MHSTAAPQCIEHVKESLNFTPFETRWVPQSARFVILGQMPRATGVIRVCQLNKGKVEKLAEVEHPKGFKCATFGASAIEERHLATGDYVGNVQIWDLEDLKKPIWSVKGHDLIINAIDGVGGLGTGNGAAELVTGSRDGAVQVWDPRQEDPVVSLVPVEGETPADCWSVAFGNSYNDAERCIAAGYDNGDIKLFDLRTMTLRWDTNVKNGVCHLQFDRKDIRMNKLGVSTLESCLVVYDLRTYHPTEGFAGRTERITKSTLWGCHFLPQNREVFATCGGNGSISMFKYSYPEERVIKDKEGIERGVPGTMEMLNQTDLSTQPVISFDWHMNKTGLCVFACLDQTCRIAICTKLHLY
mmetsp:Transcript_20113/g.53688  ORF Transcript_20113/g.53688 Transcript_20113/m.53688 type:complete len:357 (-) Transcript_20113:182-1252(-)